MTASARRATATVATHGLPGADDGTIDVDSFDQLLILADMQRVTTLLDAAIRAGRFPDAPTDWVAAVRERAVRAAETTLLTHASAADAGRRLAAAAIPAVVLKGCATGPLDYPDAGHRFSSDVDVLVEQSSLTSAIDLLGERSEEIVRNRRWHDRYGHAVTVVDEHGVNIDLHVRINHGYVGLAVPTAELVADVERYEIGGATLHALDPVGRFLVAAVHADGPRRSLHALRDVPQLVLTSGVDWRSAVELAEAWRIDALLAYGVRHAWDALGLATHPVADWARSHRARGRQRVIAGLRDRGVRRQVVAGPLALSVREWPGYVFPLLFPSAEYVRQSGKGWRQRVAILGSELGRS